MKAGCSEPLAARTVPWTAAKGLHVSTTQMGRAQCPHPVTLRLKCSCRIGSLSGIELLKVPLGRWIISFSFTVLCKSFSGEEINLLWSCEASLQPRSTVGVMYVQHSQRQQLLQDLTLASHPCHGRQGVVKIRYERQFRTQIVCLWGSRGEFSHDCLWLLLEPCIFWCGLNKRYLACSK